MRAIGIIPARMASTRFPGKPLALINGKPMIWHVWQAALYAKKVFPHYVATDSPTVFAACRELSISCLSTSPNCRSGTERCHDAMRHLKNLEGDIVINIQGDEPLIRSVSLDDLVLAFEDPDVKIASLCFSPTGADFIFNTNRVKVLVGDDGDAISFKRALGEIGWYLYKQHVGVYAYRRDVLAQLVRLEPVGDLEQLAWMAAGYRIRMLEIFYETVAVDEPLDVARAERVMSTLCDPK
jgi:3-deoxy-manno-octulosonate cytidylyltransferase (CMP-KDO synthetase)